ncbi:MAG: hypothetical protein NVS9B10_10570 [Nevskia sp.]
MIRSPGPPLSVLLLLVLLSAALGAGAILLALDEPIIDLHLRPAGDGSLLTTDRWVTQQPLDWQAAAWRDDDGIAHPIDATLLVEEPDQLPSYADWRRVLQRSGDLRDALARGHLTILDTGGHAHEFETRARRLAELPWPFWAQLAVSWCALLLSLLVWRRAEARETARHFVLSAAAYFVATCTSAVYATRELALDETVFRVLSRVNHLAGAMMPATVVVLLWIYPTRRIGRTGIALVYGLTLFTVALAQWQWPDAMPGVVYGPQALLFAAIIAGCIRQWQLGRTDAAKRAILSVYLLALLASTPVCGALVLVPQLSGRGAVVSQTIMFLSFLPGYVGLAVGISRYRLFDLDRWWFIAWAWGLGGVALLACYALLSDGFGLDRRLSLAIAWGLIGWLCLPARQWLWQRFALRRGLTPERLLPEGLALFFAQRDLRGFDLVWERFLCLKLDTLESHPRMEPVAAVTIEDAGHALAVPPVVGEDSFTLRYPDGGRRLFKREDRRWVALLWQLACCHARSGQAHVRDLQAMRTGVQRDLQDDLGSKLALLLRSADPHTAELARAALRSLHDALEALDDETRVPVDRALRLLGDAAQRRCRVAGMRLRWHDDSTGSGRLLGPRLRISLDRILGELIGHRLKHGGAHLIEVGTQLDADLLRIELRDNGSDSDACRATDPALRLIEQRVADLGGHLAWTPDGSRTRVSIQIPLGAD